jgi:hypothetical protein
VTTPRIIRITECRQCAEAGCVNERFPSKKVAFRYCMATLSREGNPRGQRPICPTKGIPDWCPLEKLEKGEPDESLA